MFLLIFGIEGHGTQLYFNIGELSVGVASRLAPFLGSLRVRTRLLPHLTLRPRPFKGSTANLQTGQCLGFATKPHACVHADSTVSQTYRQRSNRDRRLWTCNLCKRLQTVRAHYWPILAQQLLALARLSDKRTHFNTRINDLCALIVLNRIFSQSVD